MVQEPAGEMAQTWAEPGAVQERVRSTAEWFDATAGQRGPVPRLLALQSVGLQGPVPTGLQGLPLGTKLHEPSLVRRHVPTHLFLDPQ